MSPRARRKDEGAGADAPGRECLCMGLGPEWTEALERFGVPEEARRHLRNARLEVLKAVRSVVDRRIEDLSRRSERGTKVEVE